MANTSTGGATGRDYATVTLWEATVQASSEDEILECYDDADFTENAVLSGATAGFRRITVASGEGHSGTIASGGCVNNPSSSGHAFQLTDDDCELIGFGITGVTGTSSEGVRVEGDNCLVDSCVIEGEDVQDSDGIYLGNNSITATVQNCSIYKWERGGIFVQNFSGVHTIVLNTYNNTLWLNGEVNLAWTIQSSSTIDFDMINTIVVDGGGGGGEDIGPITGGSTGVTFTGDYNMHSNPPADSAHFPGVNSLGSRTATDNAAPGGGDFVIFADITTSSTYSLMLQEDDDNDAIASGIGPDSEAKVPVLDIQGDDRVSTIADMGCDEGSIEVIVCTAGTWSTGVTFAACDYFRIILDGPSTDRVKVSIAMELEET